MAQTGYTPILIYSSSTVSQAPSAGNLTNSTLGSELAINITDGKLFYKDNANAVQVIAWKTTPTTAGGTGLTSYTAGDLLYYASGTALTKLAIGATGRWLGSSGTAPQWNAPAALTKTDDTNVTLTLGGNASTALLNAASLTLGWTGQLSVGRGGTGLSAVSAGYIPFGSTATALATSGDLTFVSNNLEVYTNITARNGSGNAVFRLRTAATDMQWTGISGSSNVSLIDNSTGFTLLNIGSTTDVTVNRGNLVVGTAGKGIDFSANSHAAGMTSELLNWYEEGTWTGALTCGTSGTITLNGSYATGSYTRVGRLVTVTGIFLVSSVSSPVGALYLTGLPYANNSAQYGRTAAAVFATDLSATATDSIVGRMLPSTTQIELYKYAAGAISDLAGDVIAGSQFNINMSYVV